MAGRMLWVKMCHCAKFRGNSSNHCWDMAIYVDSHDGDRPPFWIFMNLNFCQLI